MISRSVGTYVKDRPGHDRREAINCDRIMNELGWKRNVSFDPSLTRIDVNKCCKLL
jgi:dTDP-glucose 4,6-dehydratase